MLNLSFSCAALQYEPQIIVQSENAALIIVTFYAITFIYLFIYSLITFIYLLHFVSKGITWVTIPVCVTYYILWQINLNFC